jgi:hypothetical protein
MYTGRLMKHYFGVQHLIIGKMLQILMGSFPVAQLREPFSAVQYLAERIHLPDLLKLQHPDQDEEWSAMDICDGICELTTC